MESIYDIVRQMEKDDTQGFTRQSEYVDFEFRETINTIEAYLNSKHTSGLTDSLGREKPFFNIVTAAANIWYRATDIDRKHITVKATKQSDMIKSFIATVLLQKFMRTSGFGTFLNEWGRILARYGSAVPKFVEQGGELHCSVVPWSSIICDAIDFENNIQIEKLWFTPAQLQQQKSYNQDYVKQLLDNTVARTTSEGNQKDTKDDYIPVYECHGLMPLSYITEKEEDENTYVQQMHVVTFVERKEKGEFDDYTLYSGRESKSPYMITHLIKEDNRALARGAVEHLFDAQWMVNDNAKRIKDQLELASKILFQTSDGSFVGKNAINNLLNGDILIHSVNEPITQLSNKPDISAMQSSMAQWMGQANNEVSTSEAMKGDFAPSGTAWRQVEALLNESHSLFELMTENKGFYIEKMLTDYIIPFLKKKMDTKEEIGEILQSHQIKWIDARFVPNAVIRKVNEAKKRAILAGQVYTPEMEMMESENARVNVEEMLSRMGNQRFMFSEKTWKEELKDLEWDLEIDITAEQRDRQSILATLSTLYRTVAANDPEKAQIILNKILEMTGAASPVELAQTGQLPQQQPQQPVQPQQASPAPVPTPA